MPNVQAATVSNRPDARLHAVGITTNCRWQRTLPTIGDPIDLTPANAPLVCHHCRPALLAAADQAWTAENSETALNRRQARVDAAEALHRALQTPAEREADEKRDAEFAAQFYAIRDEQYAAWQLAA